MGSLSAVDRFMRHCVRHVRLKSLVLFLLSCSTFLGQTRPGPFSGTPAAVPGPTTVSSAVGGEGAAAGLGSLLGDGGRVGSLMLSSPGSGASLATLPTSFTAFQKDGLVIKFELSKPSPSDPSTTHVKATFGNTGKR